jgi:phage-related tail fiber protein
LANGRVSSITNTAIRTTSTAQTGVVQLQDSISSTSTSNAATPNSVKTAYDLANQANTTAAAAVPSSGGTITGNLTVGANTNTNGTLKINSAYTTNHDYVEISTNTLTINLSSASVFTVNLTSDITTFTLTNYPSTTDVVNFVLIVNNDGSPRTIAWPASFRWPGNGNGPSLTETADKFDIFTFISYDGGTNWFAIISGKNL